MLWFLSLAGRQGFVVDRYSDDAFGVMEKNADGKVAFSRITLRPQIEFVGEKRPSVDAIAALHHSAHEECFIANSLKCDVVIEGR